MKLLNLLLFSFIVTTIFAQEMPSSNSLAGDVVINEFMASNDTTVADQDGEYDDWIELYNNTTEAIDLSGYSISDDSLELDQWSFPEGTMIEAGAYLIVWADKDDTQEGLHANCKLSADGETIYLTNADSVIIDEVTFDEQTTDISYGRFLNGTGDFQTMPATFNAQNTIMTGIFTPSLERVSLNVFPNPTTDLFNVEVTGLNEKERTVFVYNMLGEMIYQDNIYTSTKINTTDWAKGIYLVQVNNASLKLVVQ